MELLQGVLAVKICELAKEYGLLQSRIQICKEKNPEQLQQILEQINDECKTHRIILEQNARYGRLPAAAALAQAQLTYEQQADKLLNQDLMHDMYGKNLTFKTGGVDGCDCAAILKLIDQGKIDTTPLITHRYPLSRIAEAYDLFEHHRDNVIKTAIYPG